MRWFICQTGSWIVVMDPHPHGLLPGDILWMNWREWEPAWKAEFIVTIGV